MWQPGWEGSLGKNCISFAVLSDSLRHHGLYPARLLCPWGFPARILEWFDISYSRGSSWPRDWTQVSCIASEFLPSESPGRPGFFLLLLLLSHFSCVQLCATPQTSAHQAPLSLGFSRQEHWSGLPFPSPMQESEKWKWSHSVVSDS